MSIPEPGLVYRNPPYVLGPEILMANDIEDIVDWGLAANNIPDHWDNKGEGILVGIADTGRPDHSDVAEAVVYSENFSSSHTDIDHAGHGTHVAGTIGARLNGRGVVGVAPKCQLAVAKVLGDDGSGSNLGVARGVDYLAEKGCRIINMSLGGGFDRELARVVNEAVREGILVICAAGNEGSGGGRNTVGYPAKLDGTLAIASYNRAGQLSRFSSRGKEVHAAFPGEDILSTWPGQAYRRISGTSMATPFCAGLAALLLGAQQQHPEQYDKPVRTNRDLIEHLRLCAVDKGPTGHDRGWGWGVVDTERFFLRTGKKQINEIPLTSIESDTINDSTAQISFSFVGLDVTYPVMHDGKQGAFIAVSD